MRERELSRRIRQFLRLGSGDVQTLVGGQAYNPQNVAITGGSIGGTTSGVPILLAKNGIPVIGISSGSVAAGGAITGITALPNAYPNAYCYFPANILAASNPAGFYYCTFSTTTAGTAFLNQWTSGMPTVPTSPTAVTAGQGAFTGDVTEEFMPTIAIGAAPGVNFGMRGRLSLTGTNTAGTKTARARWSGSGGSALVSPQITTQIIIHQFHELQNRGVAALQAQSAWAMFATNALTTVQENYLAVDSSVATTLVLSLQRNTATDNAVLEAFEYWVSY